MPHVRRRHALQKLKKKLGFTRVLSIQGARQTGKSFMAREILPLELSAAHYETFDQKKTRAFADSNPESFLKKFEFAHPLIIDEAQKVPDIFDAVKYEVDQKPRPGRFVLLGSTEFSRESKIKESLTGRLSRLRLYPFNLAESLGLSQNLSKQPFYLNEKPRVRRSELLRYLERGGFPGIFAVRERQEREALLSDWLGLTLTRDLLQFAHLNPDPDLAEDLIREIPRASVPDATSLSRLIDADPRKVAKHLKLLEMLFVLHRLSPHPLGGGKPLYFLCDVGLAHFLGANFHRQLATWFLLEQLAQSSYRNESAPRLSYYRSARGGVLDFVMEDDKKGMAAIQIFSRESWDLRDFEIIKAFGKKWNQSQDAAGRIKLLVLAPVSDSESVEQVRLMPWESIA